MLRRREGFTLIELLVAGFVLTVILGLVGTFLVQQSKLNRRTQAGSEVQDKARMVMQLVTSDLRLAGASVYAATDGTIQDIGGPLNVCPTDGSTATCLKAVDGASPHAKDAIAMDYVTTLRSTSDACRQVAYAHGSQDTLYRADVACASPAALLSTTVDSQYDVLAPNVLALDVRYVCSNGVILSDFPDASCPNTSSYLRSAIVTVVARSDTRVAGQAAVTYAVPMSEAVPSSAKINVTCGPDYVCSGLTQEVLLPNLKDR